MSELIYHIIQVPLNTYDYFDTQKQLGIFILHKYILLPKAKHQLYAYKYSKVNIVIFKFISKINSPFSIMKLFSQKIRKAKINLER